jgi:RND family efflux transporter MFP subunit
MTIRKPRLLSLCVCLTVVGLFGLAGCGGGDAAGGGAPGGPPGGAMPPMGVETLKLATHPVERTSEYIATVKSRRSTTIQPQVEGLITRIVTRSGQRVGRGAVLMEVDSSRQQATVASLQSLKAAREADVQFARQQIDRMKKLFDAGAVSQQELEQAQTSVQTSEAQLQAVNAQIREQQVELAYHRVTAPTAGIVGDIPVREGDRVTRSTVLTTIDENAGLELYINVPVQQATELRPGLPVRVVDDRGMAVRTTALSFVSPSVDTATQSVLVKAPLEAGVPYRTDQFVRVALVWSAQPGLTVPLISVIRINGQYFVYVVDKGADGNPVARQRPVQLGAVLGNDYVVKSGLQPGDELVVAGVQKIGDGAPVAPTPAGAPPPAPAPPGRGPEGR